MIDKSLIKKNFAAIAATYNQHAILAQEINQRLIERFAYIKQQPKIILDLGSGTGLGSQLLQKIFSQAQIICVDLTFDMLKQNRAARKHWFRKQQAVCADASLLPLKNESVDLVFSNLMWHWLGDSTRLVAEIHRVLKNEGLLMFSALGTDSIKSYKKSEIDFPDIHDIGDQLLKAGFDQPVMDMEFIQYHYSAKEKCITDLNRQGLSLYLNDQNLIASQKIEILFEIIYGHAWKVRSKNSSVLNETDEILVSIEQIKRK